MLQKKTTQREKNFMFDKNPVFRIHKELLKLSKKKRKGYIISNIYICHIYWNLLHESHPCHGKGACVTQ